MFTLIPLWDLLSFESSRRKTNYITQGREVLTKPKMMAGFRQSGMLVELNDSMTSEKKRTK